jgi:aldehyde:ferredoxin oxidoreductase
MKDQSTGDLAAVCKANEICNRYGLDTISTGVTIAFAMECFEKGLLTKKETEGLELRFGNAEALIAMCEKIALRQGIGDLLAEGSWRAAQVIGKGAERLTMTVKGQEIPAHEPRGKWGVGLGYAVSPTGADHLQAAHDTSFDCPPNPEEEYTYIDVSDLWPFGIYEPVPAEDLGPEKVRMFTFLQRWWSLHNVLDLCIFVSAPEYRMTGLRHLEELVRSATGWNVNEWELLRAGELGITLARVFNVREGFRRQDDWLPERFFETLKIRDREKKGISKESLCQAISLYYLLMGWDEEGVPYEWKLIDLGVPWAVDMLRSCRHGR